MQLSQEDVEQSSSSQSSLGSTLFSLSLWRVGADSGGGWRERVTKCMCTDCVRAARAAVDRSKGEDQPEADGHQVAQPRLCCQPVREDKTWIQQRVSHQLSHTDDGGKQSWQFYFVCVSLFCFLIQICYKKKII